MKSVLKKFNVKKPPLDVVTRWNSTFDMLESLNALKQFCSDLAPTNKDLHLNDNIWEKIQNICNALKPAKNFTLLLEK